MPWHRWKIWNILGKIFSAIFTLFILQSIAYGIIGSLVMLLIALSYLNGEKEVIIDVPEIMTNKSANFYRWSFALYFIDAMFIIPFGLALRWIIKRKRTNDEYNFIYEDN